MAPKKTAATKAPAKKAPAKAPAKKAPAKKTIAKKTAAKKQPAAGGEKAMLFEPASGSALDVKTRIKTVIAVLDDTPVSAKKAEAAKAAGIDSASGFKEPMTYRVPYDQLKDACPDGVDPAQREQYLADDEFEKVLGSPRHEFNSLKPWKKQQLKKAVGLF